MNLKEYYKKYDKEIWGAGSIIITLIVGLLVGSIMGYNVGYEEGMNDVPSPEYKIQTFSIEMNYTLYNETYRMLTKGDMEGNWVIDIEPREDYFMIGMSIVAQSENWTRFFLYIDAYGIPMGNTTIELVHVTTYYSMGSTHEMNWYENDIGGMTCNNRADIVFLGYGDAIEGLDTTISRAVRIRGLFG